MSEDDDDDDDKLGSGGSSGLGAGEESIRIGDEACCMRGASLLGCSFYGISSLMLQRSVKTQRRGGTRTSVYIVRFSREQAAAARHALCKAIYCLLFEWVVARFN